MYFKSASHCTVVLPIAMKLDLMFLHSLDVLDMVLCIAPADSLTDL